MKRFLSLLLTGMLTGSSLLAYAQVRYKQTNTSYVIKQWKYDFSSDPGVVVLPGGEQSAPEPLMRSSELKARLDAERTRKREYRHKQTSYITEPSDISPELDTSFNGRPRGGSGIPNDNTMAISDDGIIVSAINSSVNILNDKGEFLLYRRLEFVTQGQLPNLNRTYDPKVTYDPVRDRFILVFLQGSTSADTRIVVGFTETNDPTATWNFYAINGNPFDLETWSDYPIIAQNQTDLYITVNLLQDNMSWQEGFLQSFIWQINKEDGYNGDALTQNLFYDIEYNGEPVWSICPVQPADVPSANNMYFLSVRPDAEQNDTVFLHEVTDHSKSGNAQHLLSILQANKQYGVPPSAFQPALGYRLQTNDTRVLSATLHRNRIHYVQTTVVNETQSSGIFHGVIHDVDASPYIDATILSSETLDFAYPSITFAGNTPDDEQSMVITYSHSGEWDYPGTSAIFHNRSENKEGLYSESQIIRKGDGLINTFLSNDIERWGDYTDIQRKYNEPGVVWLCGSYGDSIDRNNVWLAKLSVKNQLRVIDQTITYPNPTDNTVYVAMRSEMEQTVNVRVTNRIGQLVKDIPDVVLYNGGNKIMVMVHDLEPGMYILSIHDADGEQIHSAKIIVE